MAHAPEHVHRRLDPVRCQVCGLGFKTGDQIVSETVGWKSICRHGECTVPDDWYQDGVLQRYPETLPPLGTHIVKKEAVPTDKLINYVIGMLAGYEAKCCGGGGGIDLARNAAERVELAKKIVHTVESQEPIGGNWIESEPYYATMRKLDVALNGEAGAALRPLAIDILSQVEAEANRLGMPVLTATRELPSSSSLAEHALSELRLLGYTVEDGHLYPPEEGVRVLRDAKRWRHASTSLNFGIAFYGPYGLGVASRKQAEMRIDEDMAREGTK